MWQEPYKEEASMWEAIIREPTFFLFAIAESDRQP